METKRKIQWKKIGYIGLGVIGFLAALYLLNLNFSSGISLFLDGMKSIFIPAGIGLFLVYLTKPLYINILKKTKRKSLSATITILITFTVIIGLFSLLIYLIVDQATIVFNKISQNWPQISSWLKSIMNAEVYEQITTDAGALDIEGIKDYISENFGLMNLFSQATSGAAAIVYWIVILVMMPIFYFFFLKDGEKIFEGLTNLIPGRWHKKEVKDVMLLANTSTGQYMRGKIISILFISIIFSIGFSVVLVIYSSQIAGFHWVTAILYGILFGCILGILDLIPYIGPTIGVILPLAFMAVLDMHDPIRMGIFMAILLAVNFSGQELQRIIVEPMIMSKEVKVHPLLVLSGLMFFGTLFGFVGFILATPIVATMQNSIYYFKELYKGNDPEDEIQQLETIKKERELIMNIAPEPRKKEEVNTEEKKEG